MAENSLQQMTERLNDAFKLSGLDAQIKVKHDSFGWMKLIVIASAFEDQLRYERIQMVNEVLNTIELHLGSYPFLTYRLYTPGEVPAEEEPEPIPLPLWSDTLGAPEPQHPVFPNENMCRRDQDTTKKPFVVTFYSFEGNSGQSTTLGLVANLLVISGYRVVMFDFDLDAPGISYLFPANLADGQKYGVVDYAYARYGSREEETFPIADCIRRVGTPFRGELYLVPAGKFDEGYIHKLSDLDIPFFCNYERNPIQRLFVDVKTELEPDVVLIDAGRGFNVMGAVALLDQADLGMISFSLPNKNFEGLKWVMQAASRQRSYKGIPDLRFLLTSTPSITLSQQQSAITQAVTWIAENWQVPRYLSVDELYYQIPYNPNIPALTNLVGNREPSIIKPYQPVADAITGRIWKSSHLRKAI